MKKPAKVVQTAIPQPDETQIQDPETFPDQEETDIAGDIQEDEQEEKKPLILHAKDFDMNVYAEGAEEYNETEYGDAEIVLVADKAEKFAYFSKIGDMTKALLVGIGKNKMYPFEYAIELATKALNAHSV